MTGQLSHMIARQRIMDPRRIADHERLERGAAPTRGPGRAAGIVRLKMGVRTALALVAQSAESQPSRTRSRSGQLAAKLPWGGGALEDGVVRSVAAELTDDRRCDRPMAPVTIYTKPGCIHCIRAKRRLRRARVKFREIRAGGDVKELRRYLVRQFSSDTFPQIVLGERHVGGAADLARLDKNAGLVRLLAGEATSR